MSSSRIYRKNILSFSEIEKELVESKGKQLDAEVVDILLELLKTNGYSTSVAITKE